MAGTSSQVHIPVPDQGFDVQRMELCVQPARSFWKKLPSGAELIVVIASFSSMVKSYLGRALVLKKTTTITDFVKKEDSTLVLSATHLPATPSGEGRDRPHTKEDQHSPHRSTNDSYSEPHDEPPATQRHSHSGNQFLYNVSPGPQRRRVSRNSQQPQTHHKQDSSHISLHSGLPTQQLAQVQAQPSQPSQAQPSRPSQAQPSQPSQAQPSRPSLEEAAPIRLPQEVQTYLRVAAQCLHAQDYNQMLRTLKGIPVSPESDDRVGVAVMFGMGQAYFKMKQYEQSRPHFTEMDRLARRGEEMRGDVAIANYYLGEIHFLHSQFDEAATNYRMAITFHSTHVTVTRIFRVIAPTRSGLWNKLASALKNASKVMDAIHAYKEAISAAESKKDKLSAHTSLGNLFQSVGENSQAVNEYKVAIKLSEELNDFVSHGWAHGNLGNAYLGLLQRDQAIHHLKTSLELTLKHEPTPQAIGRAYNNLGTAFQALNELDQAQEYYDLSLSQAIYGADLGGQARVYGNIGNLFMLQKNYDGAIVHYTETLSISKDQSTKATAHHNRGCAYYEKAESEKRKLYHPAVSPATAVSGSTDQGGEKPYTLTYHGAVMKDVPSEHRFPDLPSGIRRRYKKARDDLSIVVDQHEVTFKNIRGSQKGLTLSVSLFETNSRTFHRLQDCHYNMGEWEEALVYAEQSRARTLGELLLERKRPQLGMALTAPLDLEQIMSIVGSQDLDVVVLSYTGARLLVWVLSPGEGEGAGGRREVRRAMFQVTLEEDQFDGKSLDYYLRYSLSEVLVERNVEMYAFSNYDCDDHMLPTLRLHELFAKPLLEVMSCLHPKDSKKDVWEVVVIPDSYVNLMPLVALFNKSSQEFLGNRYRFRIMPSLLTMGVLNQMPPVVVRVPQDSRRFCVVGNPTIPTFTYQGETWNLGKLPFATEEAEWVSHILGCTPTLHEQATKSVVLMVISSARVVHIATHGSAAAGFLAFANLGPVRNGDPVDENSILLYPEDIEQMAISPALVVLSSCDSGRGVVKADGILGMARAFILAGAQAVMTTLWRVPDESGAVFMKFFYQYLMDGFPASESLQKAILSLRSFTKYSGFIHWSGYQLTGREVAFQVEERENEHEVRAGLGAGPTVFPRLDMVKRLEESLIRSPDKPNVSPDVQLLHGYHGLKPSGPVVDFILKNHTYFSGGIFWLNGTVPDLIAGAMECMTMVSPLSEQHTSQPVLVVLDNITSLPQSEDLLQLLKRPSTSIAITSNTSLPLEGLKKEIDHKLIRGCSTLSLQPLTTIHSTQRIVHSIMSSTHFTPLNREQLLLERIAELAAGSPGLINITTALLQRCLEEAERDKDKSGKDFLDRFTSKIPLLSDKMTIPPKPSPTSLRGEVGIRPASQITSYTSQLISAFDLPTADHFILYALSVFGPVPIPRSLIDTLQSIVVKATQKKDDPGLGAPNPIKNLLSTMLLRPYPSPVIAPPTSTHTDTLSSAMYATSSTTDSLQDGFCYVPQLVLDSLWEKMEATDRAFTVTTAYRALLEFEQRPSLSRPELHFAAGLTAILVKKCEENEDLNLSCYKETYRLLVRYRARLKTLKQF